MYFPYAVHINEPPIPLIADPNKTTNETAPSDNWNCVAMSADNIQIVNEISPRINAV